MYTHISSTIFPNENCSENCSNRSSSLPQYHEEERGRRRKKKKEGNRERGERRMDPLHSLNILTTVSTRRRGAFSMLVGPWRHSFGAALNAPERSRFIERRASPRWNGARHRAVRFVAVAVLLRDEKGTKLLPAKGQLPSGGHRARSSSLPGLHVVKAYQLPRLPDFIDRIFILYLYRFF